MKVLLVDDEPDFLEQAKIFLKKEKEQLEIETATSANEGLELLEENDYGIIVSDYQMPGMDGLGFLETVREERNDDIPFIIFTGKGREEVAMEALNLGADRYLQKGGDPKSQYGILADAIVQEYNLWSSEKKWKESEREKSLILDSVSEIIAYHDTDHNLIWANKAYAEATGESVEEMKGRKCYEIWLGREGPCEGCPVEKTLKSGVPEEGEMSRPGEEKDWLIRGNPVRDEEGNVIGAIETTLDITERKEAEKKLQESEERYRRLFETAQDGMVILSADTGKIKDANPYIQNILGYSKEDLVGKKLWEIGTFRNIAENRERFENLVEEGYIRYEDLPLETKEGGEVPVEFVSNTYQAGGEKVVQCNIRDISERKKKEEKLRESEKRLKRSQEVADVGSWEIDLESNELTWSDETYRIFEMPKEELMDYEKFLGLIHPDDREYVDEKWNEALETGEYDIEHRIVVNGKTKWVREKADIKFDENEEPVEVIGSVQDITEEKELEEELRSRKNFVETLLEASPVFYVAIDSDGETLMMNATMLDALGYEEEEVGGKDYLSNFVPEDEREDLAEIFERIVESEESTLNENHILTKKGEEILVEWHGRPIFDEDGELEFFFGVGIDITDRREMKKKQKLFSSSLDQASAEIYWITPEGKFAYTNETVSERLGYPEDELKEMHVWDIDPNYSEEVRKKRWKKLKEEEVLNFESEHKTKDGKVYPVDVTSHYLEHGGREYEFAFAKDITERRKMEEQLEKTKERYEELFKGANELIVTTDREGYIKRVNRMALEYSRYSEDELVGESVLKIAHPEDEEKFIEFWKEILEKKGEVEKTLRVVGKDGSMNWVKTGGMPIIEDGEIVEIQYTSQVISDLVETRRREEFLHSLLRHDVRNKAQVVGGYLSLLEDLDLPEEYRKYLEKAEQATEESIDLIEKVRTLREIEEVEPEEVDLESIIREAVETCKSRTSEMDFRIEMKCPIEGCMVKGGPLLNELFFNILENSIQHSEGSKVRISNRENSEEMICIIEDDGKGIPDEEKEKIFVKGYKKGEDAGTGLGMYLAKEIIEGYGGSIEIKDSELGGVCFEVHLKKA